MKKSRSFVAFILFFCILISTSCSRIDRIVAGDKTLKVGTEDISGIFNPFYAYTEADKQINSQIFQSVQRKGSDNKLINFGGAVSYEFVDDGRVKYTVTIRDDMKFSNGKSVKIDDIIFFYHFIADASYDGPYKDWYKNDIVGLKEYYYDDINYKEKLDEIKYDVLTNYSSSTISSENYINYLVDTALEGKFDANSSPNGSSWSDYFSENGYAEKYVALGTEPDNAKLLRLAAEAEAAVSPEAYDPSEFYYNKLCNEYISKSYEKGTDVPEITGIKKVDDHTCTILFNSKNINSVSEINALIVSKDFYAVNYIKGSADKVKEINETTVGSGPYTLSDIEDDEVTLIVNNNYYSDKPEFKKIKFIDIAAKDIDPIKGINSGELDVVSTAATATKVSELSKDNANYYLTYADFYLSMFFNAKTLNENQRKVLSYACNFNSLLEYEIGSYYISLARPISVRFSEYPDSTSAESFDKNTLDLYMNTVDIAELSAYYCGDEGNIEFSILTELKATLAEYDITLNIISASYEELDNAARTGKADIWLENVYDGATSDKYDYYNSKGVMNKTGFNDPTADSLTYAIRSGIGITDRVGNTRTLLDYIYKCFIEYPVYQQQIMTVYNTSTVNDEALKDGNDYDGFTYALSELKPV